MLCHQVHVRNGLESLKKSGKGGQTPTPFLLSIFHVHNQEVFNKEIKTQGMTGQLRENRRRPSARPGI
jgi:hypothetical protein